MGGHFYRFFSNFWRNFRTYRKLTRTLEFLCIQHPCYPNVNMSPLHCISPSLLLYTHIHTHTRTHCWPNGDFLHPSLLLTFVSWYSTVRISFSLSHVYLFTFYLHQLGLNGYVHHCHSYWCLGCPNLARDCPFELSLARWHSQMLQAHPISS